MTFNEKTRRVLAFLVMPFAFNALFLRSAFPQAKKAGQASSQEFQIERLGPATMRSFSLTRDRKWETTTGTVLFGSAKFWQFPDVYRIENMSVEGTGVASVIIPAAFLSESSQAILLGAVPKIDKASLIYGILSDFEGTFAWTAPVPNNIGFFQHVVAVESDRVVLREMDTLFSVDKKYIAQKSYTALLEKYRAFGNGRNVYVPDSFLLSKVSGILLAETEDAFILEKADEPITSPKLISPGTRFRLPKYLVPSSQIDLMHEILQRVAESEKVVPPTSDEMCKMICIRQYGGGAYYIEPFPEAKEGNVLIHWDEKRTTQLPFSLFPCQDLVAMEQERLDALSAPKGDDNKKLALSMAVSFAFKREHWSCGSDGQEFGGKLLGRIADGFAFQYTGNPTQFFVRGDELSEVDLQVANMATEGQDSAWTDQIDVVSLFSTRLFNNGLMAKVCQIGTESLVVDSAIKGSVPVLKDINNINGQPISLTVVDFPNLTEIEASRKFIRDRDTSLASNDLTNIPTAPQKGKTPNPKMTDSANVSAFEPKMASWKLLDSNTFFQGALVGQYADDWVFEDIVNDEHKYFLASPEILDAESRKRGIGILPKTEKRHRFDRSKLNLDPP